jgi:hypothetical protein
MDFTKAQLNVINSALALYEFEVQDAVDFPMDGARSRVRELSTIKRTRDKVHDLIAKAN